MPARNLEGNRLTRHIELNGLPVAGRRTRRMLPQSVASSVVSVEGVSSRPYGREER